MSDILENEGRRPLGEIPTTSSIQPGVKVGRSGTQIYAGYIYEPETDGTLTRQQKYKTFSEILANVATVATGVRFFQNLATKARWSVEPIDDSAEAEEVADKIDHAIHDMDTPWHRVVRRAIMYKFYGFSIHEWTAKRNDEGFIGFLDVEARPQITIEQWDTDVHGKVLGVVQRSPQTSLTHYLPREKIVHINDDSLNDSPEGLGLFRHLIEPARRLRRYLQLEGFGYENDLRGTPIARAPLADLDNLVKSGQISEEDRGSILSDITSFLESHIKNPELGMLLDSKTYVTADSRAPSQVRLWDLELLDGGNYSLEEIHEAIKRVMLEIARLLGIEHLLMGDGDSGSFAMSRDKSQNFGLLVDNTLKELAEQFRKDLIKPLFVLNGWDLKLMPKFKVESIAVRDLDQLSTVVRDLAIAGVQLSRGDEAVKEILDLLGLSRLREDILLDPEATPGGQMNQFSGPNEEANEVAPQPSEEDDGPSGDSDDRE